MLAVGMGGKRCAGIDHADEWASDAGTVDTPLDNSPTCDFLVVVFDVFGVEDTSVLSHARMLRDVMLDVWKLRLITLPCHSLI